MMWNIPAFFCMGNDQLILKLFFRKIFKYKTIMKTILLSVLLFGISAWQANYGQSAKIDRVEFFKDTSVMHASIITNARELLGRDKKKGLRFPANFNTRLPDGTIVNDQVILQIRGKFRRSYCYLPPLKIIFDLNASSKLYPLKSLKLVNECNASWKYQEYILKEFVIYKIYNLLTDMSFRVRLLKLNFQDSSGKKKTITEHAFLIEDIKDLAKRNSCKEWKKGYLKSEQTDRKQMTIVAIFEYMIGNTDWGVSQNHNTVVISPGDDTLARPFVVPYDFDYSGLVNTDYAVPDEKLDIQSVQQRLYRGFPRTITEINEVLEIFKQQKDNIYELIKTFDLLPNSSKHEMIDYLDDFYDLIKSPGLVRSTFIDNARTR